MTLVYKLTLSSDALRREAPRNSDRISFAWSRDSGIGDNGEVGVPREGEPPVTKVEAEGEAVGPFERGRIRYLRAAVVQGPRPSAHPA